tara:strand:+ start:4679 stop:5683 length:1005 start_codon:yes stop_codon:yes gene_type:complete
MIKFFRKIRKNLLSENKISKYLLYAIGEIVLVIVGILIALNLNNRSERIASKAKVDLIFIEVMKELATNIKLTDKIMSHYATKDTIYSLIKTKSLTYQDYKENKIPGLSGYIRGRENITLSQYAFDNLILNLDAIPLKYSIVLNDLRVLNSDDKTSFSQYDEKMNDFVEKNIDYQLQNFAWFSESNSSQEQLDKKIHYLLNDSIYRNVAQRFNNIGYSHLYFCLAYRKKAIECYQKIGTLMNIKTMDDSFRLDSELSKNWLGSWGAKQFPDEVVTFYEDNNQLHIKGIRVGAIDAYMLSKNKIVDEDGYYYSLIRENDEYVFIVDGLEYRKLKI